MGKTSSIASKAIRLQPPKKRAASSGPTSPAFLRGKLWDSSRVGENLFHVSLGMARGVTIQRPPGYLVYLVCREGIEGIVHVFVNNQPWELSVMGEADLSVVGDPEVQRCSALYVPKNVTKPAFALPDPVEGHLPFGTNEVGTFTIGALPLKELIRIAHFTASAKYVIYLWYIAREPSLRVALTEHVMPALGIIHKREGFVPASAFSREFDIAKTIGLKRKRFGEDHPGVRWSARQRIKILGVRLSGRDGENHQICRVSNCYSLDESRETNHFIGVVETNSLPRPVQAKLRKQYREQPFYGVFTPGNRIDAFNFCPVDMAA